MKPYIGVLFTILTLSGCATYSPMPLTPDAVGKKLRPPRMAEVRLRARAIKHPLLKPIPFDDRDGLSPDEAAILAVLVNPTLRAVRDRKGIAEAQLFLAGILPNPQLSFSLETPAGGGTRGKVNAFGVGLGWDITSLISRSARTDAARAHLASIDLEVAWQEWQAAEAAKLQVYRLKMAQKRLIVARQMETVLHQSYQAIKLGVVLGVKTASDLSAAESGLQEAHSAVLQSQGAIERKRLALNRALGLPPRQTVRLERSITLPSFKNIPSAKALAADIEKRRLDLLALKLGYETQEARVRAAIQSQFPKINIGLSGSKDTDGLQTAGVGVTINLPFLDRNQGQIAVERATRQQLFDEYIVRLFGARADIARIVKELELLQMRVMNIDKWMPVLKKLAESYKKAVDQGRADILSYYQTLSRIYSKRFERIKLERRSVNLKIALEIASGRYSLFDYTSQSGRLGHTKGSEALK